MGKLNVNHPRTLTVPDLTNASTVERIWADAAAAVRSEAAAVARRRRRASTLSALRAKRSA